LVRFTAASTPTPAPFPTRRSSDLVAVQQVRDVGAEVLDDDLDLLADVRRVQVREPHDLPRRRLRVHEAIVIVGADASRDASLALDRKVTRLNSSHVSVSSAVFCSE